MAVTPLYSCIVSVYVYGMIRPACNFRALAGCQSSDVIQVCTISLARLASPRSGITIEFRQSIDTCNFLKYSQEYILIRYTFRGHSQMTSEKYVWGKKWFPLRDPAEHGRHPNTFPNPTVYVLDIYFCWNPSRRDIRVLERDRARWDTSPKCRNVGDGKSYGHVRVLSEFQVRNPNENCDFGAPRGKRGGLWRKTRSTYACVRYPLAGERVGR